MADEELSAEDQQELDELAGLVAESLAKGEKPADVSKQLVSNGWEQDAADEFVASIGQHLANAQRAAAQSDEGGGGMGWLIWIGALLFINLLSWLFGWSFWIY
ncbi:MAG: hypothetical protein H8E66_00790 [Planctomycetes bacterium]|nr:hypothetical protein [Planctomycetota bacterium]